MRPHQANTLAEFCKAVREREDKSMRDFADQTGVVWMMISKAENGSVKLPMSYLRTLKPYCSEKELSHLLNLILES